MLYLALAATAIFALYTWVIAFGELQRRNYFGGLLLALIGFVIGGLGVWESLFW